MLSESKKLAERKDGPDNQAIFDVLLLFSSLGEIGVLNMHI